jgi:DNA-binding CsgD family transcriptional regulator
MVETEVSVVIERPTTSGRLPLVDRDEVLQQFEAIFSGLEPSRSGYLSIEGGWGMGRTSLLNAACLSAERAGCVVLRVGGMTQERSVAFGVLRRIIEDMAPLRHANDDITERTEEVLSVLQRDAERSFGTLGAAFYGLLLAARKIGPVLLAIDDANLVDDATMTTLEYLYHRVDDLQIWLLTTSPSRQPGAGPIAIEELLVRHDVRHVALSPLGRDGVQTVLTTELSVEPAPAFVDAVLEATRGRAALVVEFAKACRAAGLEPNDRSLEDLDQLAIPGIANLVATRLEELSPSDREVLEACAVWGVDDDDATVQRFTGVRADAFERSVEHLRHAELLQFGGSLSFVAPVVRWAVLQEMAPVRRSELHARCADELASTGASTADVVRHLLATEPAWSDEVALKLCVAGRRLFEEGDVELAARCQWRLLNEGPFSEPVSALWLDVAKCEVALGLRTSLASFQRALALGADDEEQVLKVALALMDRLPDWPEVHVEGVATLQTLSKRLGAVDPTSRLQFELGFTLLTGHPARRSYDVARIDGIIHSSDDRSSTGLLARLFLDVLNDEKDSNVTAGDVAERFGSVFVTHGIPIGDFTGRVILMRACRLLLHSDQFGLVDEFLEVARRRAYSEGDVALEDEALRLTVRSKLWQGSLDEADEALRRQAALADGCSARHVVGSVDLLLAHDQTEEALRRVTSIDLERIVDPIEYALTRVERGRLFAAVARPEEALVEYRYAKAVMERVGLHNEVLVAWRPSMARALVTIGSWDEARTLASAHLAAARSFGARRALGIALWAMADVTRDSYERFKLLTESLAFLDDSPSALEAAGVMIELGALWAERRDRENARAMLERGLTLASTCKAERLVRIATSLLASSGTRTRPAGPTGANALTPVELRAVNLASSHATNRAIADELSVNVKSIEGHLAQAYRISSRFEIEDAMTGTVDDS